MLTINPDTKVKIQKVAVVILRILGFGIAVYLIALPFYPRIIYKVHYEKNIDKEAIQDVVALREENKQYKNAFPDSDYSVSPNRLIIKKIGVNAPIVESANEEYGLSKGAWRVPTTSKPDKGGNTVITGHRFKYLPPNNLTFYLFHEIVAGDLVSVIWEDEDYIYRVRETKIVPATEVSIMDPSNESILTLFTCDPIYSTKNRLVIIAELIE
jgi:LPXTG-site transpeptidase (sortase) family protein